MIEALARNLMLAPTKLERHMQICCICGAKMVFHFLWKVSCTTVRSTLLYGSETWPLRQNVQRLEVFGHCCLLQLTKAGWSDRVRKCVFGGNGSDMLSRRTKFCRLRWLGHVLRMSSPHLPHRALFSVPQRVEEQSRRPTDDVAAWDEEYYRCFEQSEIAAFTWLGSKR